jgi:twinkle protein
MIFETVIDKETLQEYQVKATKTGENPQPCPVCSQDRKKKNTACFSYNSQKELGNCSHCGKHFYKKRDDNKTYVRPEWTNKTQLSDRLLTWFLQRNINQQTLIDMRVTESVEFMPQVGGDRNTINFNYFRDGKLINVKYRDGEKNFKMFKDAEKIFYNLDGIKEAKEIFIVEGEIDCLTMIQQGHKNTVSVPNGATKGTNNLNYLDNCYQYFESAEKVYILTDHDEPGDNLGNELARRIGIEKCYRIHLNAFKDVNEQFCKTGTLDLSDCRSYPITGIYGIGDHWEDVENILRNGYPQGWKPRGRLGDLISFHPGYTTVTTGIPGHGKSELIDQVVLQITIDYDLRGGFFTPENWPTATHILKHVEKLMGKSAFKCNELERTKAREYLTDRFYWIYPEEDYSLTTILAKVRQAVLKHGIRWFVMDPWNKLEHRRNGMSETDYISVCLDQISNFNKQNGTHCFLVVHPKKMEFDKASGKYEIPGLYDINGSANWYNKADIGLSMYKTGDGTNTLYIQKVKFKYWGGVGEVNYNWNSDNGRYDEYAPDFTRWVDDYVKPPLINFYEPADKKDDVPF